MAYTKAYRKTLSFRTKLRIAIIDIREAVFKALRLEGCMICSWGIARYNNEITLKGHIGVVGLRCNKCQANHNLTEEGKND